MRTLVAALLCAALIAPAAVASDPVLPLAKGRFVPYAGRQVTLDNGLKIVVFPTHPGSGMFAMYELVGTGSRDEIEPGHSGFAHFFEHMMFRGTERFPADKRNQLLSSHGVDDGGYTTDDFTMYHFTGPASALPAILELEADRYMNLKYSEDAFRTEAKAVLGEYNKNFSNPDRRAWEALRALAYDQHTYQHTTLGFLADIKRMPDELAYSRQFFERYYTPDNVMVFIAGDVDVEQTIAMARERFGDWQGKRARPAIPAEPPQTAERREHVAWASKVLPRLHVAWRLPSSVADRKSSALATVLETYLFSSSSTLHRELVIDEGIVDSMGCWWSPHKDAALFPVVITMKPEARADDVLARVQASLDAIARGKVDARRFNDVKSHLKYSVLMEMTSPDSVAGTVAYYAGHSLDVGALDGMLVAIDQATPADLVTLVKTHFGAQQRTIVTVAHDAAAEGGKAP
jgi:zinc protease